MQFLKKLLNYNNNQYNHNNNHNKKKNNYQKISKQETFKFN